MGFNLSFQDVLERIFDEDNKVYYIGEKFAPSVALARNRDCVTFVIRTWEGILIYGGTATFSEGMIKQKYKAIDKDEFKEGIKYEAVYGGPES